jgi:hypothetical protein
MTSSPTKILDFGRQWLVARATGTGVRHVSGGGVPTAGNSAWRTVPIVGLGLKLTTRGRLICLDAAMTTLRKLPQF